MALCSYSQSSSGSPALAAVTQQLLDGSISPLTTNAYKKNIAMFQQFCESELRHTHWFPSKMSAVVSFIAFCFKKGYASSSITSALSAVSYIHKMHNLSDPTATFLVQKLLHGATKLRPSCDQRAPVTKVILHDLVRSAQHISICYYNNVLTSAMYLLAFHAFLRIGEIAAT